MTSLIEEHIHFDSNQIESTPSTPQGRFAWIDVRALQGEELASVVQAALHHRVAGIVSSDPDVLKDLPPTILRVLVVPDLDAAGRADKAIADVTLVHSVGSGDRVPLDVNGNGGVSRPRCNISSACL